LLKSSRTFNEREHRDKLEEEHWHYMQHIRIATGRTDSRMEGLRIDLLI